VYALGGAAHSYLAGRYGEWRIAMLYRELWKYESFADAIRAVYGGTVLYRGWLKGYGNLIILDHGTGYYTLYAHASELLVAEGDRVKAGQGIARVGETGSLAGPRLYFEIRYQGRPEDPEQWLRRRS